MVRIPESPMCSATIHTVKVPANCRMIELGASLILSVTRIQIFAKT